MINNEWAKLLKEVDLINEQILQIRKLSNIGENTKENRSESETSRSISSIDNVKGSNKYQNMEKKKITISKEKLVKISEVNVKKKFEEQLINMIRAKCALKIQRFWRKYFVNSIQCKIEAKSKVNSIVLYFNWP